MTKHLVKKSPLVDLDNHKVYTAILGAFLALVFTYVFVEFWVKEYLPPDPEITPDPPAKVVYIPPTNTPPPPPPEKQKSKKQSLAESDEEEVPLDTTEFNVNDFLPPSGDDDEVEEDEAPKEVYVPPTVDRAEIPANFPYGSWDDYVKQQFQFPAADAGKSGRMLIGFTVDYQGYVRDVKVIRGMSATMDAEAIRVISNSPKWEPGKVQGRPVNEKHRHPFVVTP